MPDYRTRDERLRDAKREAAAAARAEAETQRRNQLEIDRRLALRTIFPEIPTAQLGDYYHVHAAHHGGHLEVAVETWMRLFHRSTKLHAMAVAAGDTGATALALDEVEQIRGIGEQLVAAFAIEDERRLVESSA